MIGGPIDDRAQMETQHALALGAEYFDNLFPDILNDAAKVDFVTTYASLYLERVTILEHEERYAEDKERGWE